MRAFCSQGCWERGSVLPRPSPCWTGLTLDIPHCRESGSLVGHTSVTEWGDASKWKSPEKGRNPQQPREIPEPKVAEGRG